MKKVVFSQVFAENGITNFSGLYDENGLPVNVELEVNEDGVVMTILRRELTDEEQMKICDRSEDCGVCPISELCREEAES